MLSVLIHRAVNAFAFQNQIRSRRMSGPTPQTPATNGHDLSQLVQWLCVGGVALLVAGGIAVLLLLSSRAADSLVLAILSILAMAIISWLNFMYSFTSSLTATSSSRLW